MEQCALGAGPTMKTSEFKKLAPEELAERIRKLAIDTHHALNNPFVTAARIDELSRQIHELRKEASAACLSQIDCWLHQVQRQVENLGQGFA
jgi:hypothetical protein